MFRTLYSKLAAVLLLLFLVVSMGLVVATARFLAGYQQEAEQRLNLSLAQHLAEQNLAATGPDQDADRLRRMFDRQMAVNPNIQIYLLDAEGTVTAHAQPPAAIVQPRVALAPLLALIGGKASLPILGDDPKDPAAQKPFSATRLADGGFLYVVLSADRSAAASPLAASGVILRALLGALAIGLLFVVAAGLILFAFLTRRLRRLAAVMEAFQASDFRQSPAMDIVAADGGGDEIDRLAGTFRDMAARMALQLSELRSSDALRRELLANVSHDLKTPLASMRGYIDTLLLKHDALTADERRHYLEVASRGGERLSALVANLVELAKLDAKEVTLAREAFPIAELAQDVLQKFQLRAEQKRLRLTASLPPGTPYVCADIALIERVLENLIANAIKHTDAGGSVALNLAPHDAEVAIEVADTGCGIDKDELPRIFERFYRVNDDHRARGSHAGLGLAITKSILDLHNVEVSVRSEPGAGTAFTFSLPTAVPGSAECNS